MSTDESHVFSVSPPMADVAPQKSASFQVLFKPVSTLFTLSVALVKILFGYFLQKVITESAWVYLVVQKSGTLLVLEFSTLLDAL